LTEFQSAFVAFAAVLVAGTIFYAIFENCTCGYSESKVDGCIPDNCEATGGYVKSVLDAWYMSCVSLTTIGFGDFAPKSIGGRVFSIIWMVLGVIAVGNFACQFSKAFLDAERKHKQLQINVDDIFDKIDKDGSGKLDRTEFLIFAVMEYGLLTEEDVGAINEQFDDIDEDGSGEVTKEEIMKKFGKLRVSETQHLNDSVAHRVSVTLGVNGCPEIIVTQCGGSNSPKNDRCPSSPQDIDGSELTRSVDSAEALAATALLEDQAKREEALELGAADVRIIEPNGSPQSPSAGGRSDKKAPSTDDLDRGDSAKGPKPVQLGLKSGASKLAVPGDEDQKDSPRVLKKATKVKKVSKRPETGSNEKKPAAK